MAPTSDGAPAVPPGIRDALIVVLAVVMGVLVRASVSKLLDGPGVPSATLAHVKAWTAGICLLVGAGILIWAVKEAPGVLSTMHVLQSVEEDPAREKESEEDEDEAAGPVWDPLEFSGDTTEHGRRWRQLEIKHGHLSLLANVGLVATRRCSSSQPTDIGSTCSTETPDVCSGWSDVCASEPPPDHEAADNKDESSRFCAAEERDTACGSTQALQAGDSKESSPAEGAEGGASSSASPAQEATSARSLAPAGEAPGGEELGSALEQEEEEEEAGPACSPAPAQEGRDSEFSGAAKDAAEEEEEEEKEEEADAALIPAAAQEAGAAGSPGVAQEVAHSDEPGSSLHAEEEGEVRQPEPSAAVADGIASFSFPRGSLWSELVEEDELPVAARPSRQTSQQRGGLVPTEASSRSAASRASPAQGATGRAPSAGVDGEPPPFCEAGKAGPEPDPKPHEGSEAGLEPSAGAGSTPREPRKASSEACKETEPGAEDGTELPEGADRPTPRLKQPTPTVPIWRKAVREAQPGAVMKPPPPNLRPQNLPRPPKNPNDKDMRMQEILHTLETVDQERVLIVRKIKRLGFHSARSIRLHFEQYGGVDNVYVSHSHLESRSRPAGLGFVVMDSRENAQKALDTGLEQDIHGLTVFIGPFEQLERTKQEE